MFGHFGIRPKRLPVCLVWSIMYSGFWGLGFFFLLQISEVFVHNVIVELLYFHGDL